MSEIFTSFPTLKGLTFIEGVFAVMNWVDGNILWGVPMILLIIGCGVLLTVKTRCLQVKDFGYALKMTMGNSIRQMRKIPVKDIDGKTLVTEDNAEKHKNAISPFEAFSTAVSGTVGTGNIVGRYHRYIKRRTGRGVLDVGFRILRNGHQVRRNNSRYVFQKKRRKRRIYRRTYVLYRKRS